MYFILWIINPKVINFVFYISFCGWITFLDHTPEELIIGQAAFEVFAISQKTNLEEVPCVLL